MQLQAYFDQARVALAHLPFLSRIESQEDYQQALMAMEDLIEDYEANEMLIDLLASSIETWEESSPEFAAFNNDIAKMDGVDILKLLMEQHQLGVADLPELGSKGNVSKILNRVNGRSLTLNHIQGLSKRFGVPAALFV